MGENVERIIARLRDEGTKTLDLFRELAPDQWSLQVYTDGMAWRIQQLLAHFISVEHAFQFYGRDIMAGGEGAPEDFVIDEFNEREVTAMQAATPGELLVQFEEARDETIEFVASLSDEDLLREGRHPFFGWGPVDKFLKLIYRHNMMHQRDIRRVLDGG